MRLLLIACCLLLLLPMSFARAHPHVWADITVDILFDGAGNVTGLRQTWLFDDYYTAFALEGMERGADGAPIQAALDEIMTVNLEHLKEYGYFTEGRDGDETLTVTAIEDRSSRMEGNRLEMTFTTRFDRPVPAQGDRFSYGIFDPTYYVDMLHAEVEDPVRLTGAPDGCSYRLIAPTPTPAAIAEAAMLDATQTGPTGLGRVFAENVRLLCPGE